MTAAAPVDPTVATLAASDVTQTTATLNASITNPDNMTVTAKGFEWRPTTSATYTQVNGIGIGNTFSASLSNLTANSSYTYRAFISFNGNTVYGNETTFTTLEEPIEPCDVPTGLTVSYVTHESVTINWDANPNVNIWNIQYRPVNGSYFSASSATNSYTLTGLTPVTTYQIQVQADCGDGNLSEWTDITATTTVGIESYPINSNNISLYPNPAKEYVTVQTKLEITDIEVFDLYGKLIRTVNETENPTRINISGLADGMYFVRITTEQGVVTKTFVKNRM